MPNRDKGPPNYREAPRCAVCIRADPAWYCRRKKHDMFAGWNNLCDDYEPELPIILKEQE